MSEYEEDCREEDRWLGRLMFDEICEIRPNESLRLEYAGGVYISSVYVGDDWKVIGIGMSACEAVDDLIEYLGITDEEIEANAERRA
jgi:hypothetical protein